MVVKISLENLDQMSREVRGAAYSAGTRAVRLATRQLEQDLEAQTRGAVPGNAWRAWRSSVYPRDDAPAKDPVGEVFANGKRRTKGMLTYWSQPGTNRAAGGGWLAIPLPEAGSTGRSRHLTPREWEARTGLKLTISYPKRSRGWALLVTDGTYALKRKAGIKKLTARRAAQGREKVRRAIFMLIPEQEFANRVSISSAVTRATRRMADELAKGLSRLN